MPTAIGVEPTNCPPVSIGGGQAVVGPSSLTGVGVVSFEPPMHTAAGVEPTKCPPMPESIRATGAGQAVVEPPMPTAIGVEHLSSYPAHLPLPPAQPFVPTPILLPMPQPLYELPPSEDPPITGSRIGRPGWQFDLEYMQRLGMPRTLLQELADGVRMNFNTLPEPYFRKNHGSASRGFREQEIVHKDLLRLYSLGKVSDLCNVRPAVTNPLGLVIKGAKVRTVLDASISKVNDCQSLIFFPLPTARDIVSQLSPGCWVAKLDCADAYLMVPLHPSEAGYFGVRCPLTERYFQYDYLPFGSRNAGPRFCMLMEQIVKAIEREWRRYGIVAKIGNFSDDSWCIAETKSMCEAALAVACSVFQRAGLYVKPSKVIPGSQCQEIIGVVFDTVESVLTITKDRRQQLVAAIEELLSESGSTMGVFETLVGRLTFVQCAVDGLGPGMQSLYPHLPQGTHASAFSELLPGLRRRGYQQRRLHLSDDATLALNSIRKKLELSPSRRMHIDAGTGTYYLWDSRSATSVRAQVEIDTDASGLHGWGIRWMNIGDTRAGRWNSAWLDKHINLKELYCLVISLRWWGKRWQREGLSRVLAHCDNTVTVSCVNKLRSPSSELCRLCAEINRLCQLYGLEVVAVHKPGYLNTVPDALSRGTLAPASEVFTLSRCGIANLCNRLCIRGKVRTLDFTTDGPEEIRVHAQRGAVIVGFAPHRMAVQTLKELLVIRRDFPAMKIAVCMSGHTYKFLAEIWGSLPRYFEMRPLWRTGTHRVLKSPKLDDEHGPGQDVLVQRSAFRVVVLTFRGSGQAKIVNGDRAVCAGNRCVLCDQGGGELLACTRCARSAHRSCLGLSRTAFVLGNYTCAECRVDVAVTPSARSATGFREAAEYINTVLAVNRESSTLRGYRTALNHLKKFEDSHDVSSLPMDPEFAKLAFSRLALDGHSMNVLSGIRTTVSRWHEVHGYLDPFSDDQLLELWSALKRDRGKPVKHHAEMPYQRFVELVEWLVRRGKATDIRDAVAICLGYMGFRRHSEICGRKVEPDFDRGFRLCDIDVSKMDRTRCFIRATKVDTMGKGATCVISSSTNSGINFRSLVLQLFSCMGITQAEAAISEAPLIQSLGRDGLFTGRRFRVDQRFKLLQQQQNPSAEVFTIHCTRVGGASHAINSGIDADLGKAHGVWTSDAFWLYARSNEQRRLTVTSCM